MMKTHSELGTKRTSANPKPDQHTGHWENHDDQGFSAKSEAKITILTTSRVLEGSRQGKEARKKL